MPSGCNSSSARSPAHADQQQQQHPHPQDQDDASVAARVTLLEEKIGKLESATATPIWWGVLLVIVLYIVASHAYQLVALSVLMLVLAKQGMIPDSIRMGTCFVAARIWERLRGFADR
jgi:hypothetical protein